MLKIVFDEPDDEAWRTWRERCDQETERLIEQHNAGQKLKIKKELYKETKNSVYMNPDGPFFGLCAFCGEKLRPGQPGDIEHFRPKSRVDDWPNGPRIRITENGVEKDHPGYYWLSYDWKNLLPSCLNCNRPSTDPVSGVGLGKKNYFPVEGIRALSPGEEQNERVLLIHPCRDEPSDHMKFDPLTGLIIDLDERGRVTKEVFQLNDRGLPDERKAAYDNVKSSFATLRLKAILDGIIDENRGRYLRKCREGRERYPIATKTAYEHADEGNVKVDSIFD